MQKLHYYETPNTNMKGKSYIEILFWFIAYKINQSEIEISSQGRK